jgi:2-dehydropantoate 2-reductase
MRILIAGAGAVGGYFGALLVRAEQAVTLLARGPNAAALREHGLDIDSWREGRFQVRAPVVSSLAEAAQSPHAPFDLILVAVKAHDLAAVARELASARARLLAEGGLVLPLLNGVESEQVLADELGSASVIGGVAHVGAELIAPGQVKHTSRGEILVAPLAGAPPAPARELATRLAERGFPIVFEADLAFITWRKLVWNNAFNAVTALTNTKVSSAATHPRLRELLRGAMNEALLIARAEKVKLPPEIVEVMLQIGEQFGDGRTSMHQDVLAGRPTEHEILNGVVCRLGRRHGIPTPINDTLTALLDGRRPSAKA